MSDNRKTPFGKLNRRAEQIAGDIDTKKLEDEIGEALADAWQAGYDEGCGTAHDEGYQEGKAEGIREAEEKFKAKEKVTFT
jgi:flagellar biosynthesis/type III secretory pathway protein FliH